MIRRRALLAVLAVAIFAATACDVASQIVVHPDGSGSYAIVITVPNGPGDPGGALYRTAKAAVAHSTVPLAVAPYSAGGQDGARLSFTFRSLADLRAETARLSSLGNGLGGVTVTRDGSGWHFAATSSSGPVAPPGQAPKGSTGGPINGSAIAQAMNIAVVLELPGLPGENNASAVTHGATTTTFNWALPVGRPAMALQASTTFVAGQATTRLASALTPVSHGARSAGSASGPGTTGSMVVVLGAVALLAGGGGAVTIRRRRQSARATPIGQDIPVPPNPQ